MSKPDAETLKLRLAAALKSLREDRGLSVRHVAERMGKKRTAGIQITRWELGQASPGAYQLWAFLIAIDASFADLERKLNPKPPTNRRLREIAREIEALSRSRAR